MKMRLEIELGNATMQTPFDVAAALTLVATSLEGGEGFNAMKLRDSNGNAIGFVVYEMSEFEHGELAK
jgi:hypothetical protein